MAERFRQQSQKKMEKRLYDAALRGDVTNLDQLLEEDSFVLEKAALKGEDNLEKNPLHVAAMLGHANFVKKILTVSSTYIICLSRDRYGRNPLHLAAMYGKLNVLQEFINTGEEAIVDKQAIVEMCLARDQDGRNPLHLAAMYGRLEVAQKLILAAKQVASEMCSARDRDGRNHLHLAAIYGRLDVLEKLIPEENQVAQEKTDDGETILHLCIKYNQPQALRILVHKLKHSNLVNAKNKDRSTIWHLAILYNQNEAIKCLAEEAEDGVFIKNGEGKSALDLLWDRDYNSPEIQNFVEASKMNIKAQIKGLLKDQLDRIKANPRKLHDLVDKSRDAIMVVASLTATMAFQVAVSPPGGVWQDDLLEGPNPHKIGEAIMGHTHPSYYRQLIRATTVAFVSSLATIIMVMRGFGTPSRHFVTILALVMMVAVISIGLTYAASLVMVAPKDIRGGPLGDTGWIVLIVVTTWSYPIISLLLKICKFILKFLLLCLLYLYGVLIVMAIAAACARYSRSQSKRYRSANTDAGAVTA